MVLRIQQLPSAVANQIAAGEVIERPASVVKELLENAYDAGADILLVEIGFGGLNQVKVSDNGSGIVAEDLPLAIAAHSTSKIKQLKDLYSIHSMGFRGEALASIASVSKTSISSKTITQEHAMMLSAQAEQIRITPTARSNGTTIDVCDLFYNVPVRKKFLKTERLEFLAIDAVVRRFAMGAPHIALTLMHNGKTVLDLPAANSDSAKHKRMVRLFGQGFAKDAIQIDVSRGEVHLYGWISGPDYQRSQNDRLWVYINQRMVKDKLIHHAIKQAYDDILHPGRSPSCLLYFNLPTQEVDVNVHPTKHEVRFQQPRWVHDFFTSQLSLALKETDNRAEASEVTLTQPEASAERFEIRESTYQSKGLTTSSAVMPVSRSSWTVLSSRYVIAPVVGSVFLLDAKLLQQHYLLSQFEQQPRPLAQRPVLVPMCYDISLKQRDILKKNQLLFSELGLDYDLGKNTQIMIRALPAMLPQLNLVEFINALSDKSMDGLPVLFQLLLSCHDLDLQLMTEEEKLELSSHLAAMNAKALSRLPWCKLLDEMTCEALLR